MLTKSSRSDIFYLEMGSTGRKRKSRSSPRWESQGMRGRSSGNTQRLNWNEDGEAYSWRNRCLLTLEPSKNFSHYYVLRTSSNQGKEFVRRANLLYRTLSRSTLPSDGHGHGGWTYCVSKQKMDVRYSTYCTTRLQGMYRYSLRLLLYL
jgi:hypothetical protein